MTNPFPQHSTKVFVCKPSNDNPHQGFDTRIGADFCPVTALAKTARHHSIVGLGIELRNADVAAWFVGPIYATIPLFALIVLARAPSAALRNHPVLVRYGGGRLFHDLDVREAVLYHALVAISDTGSGMTTETRRCFM